MRDWTKYVQENLRFPMLRPAHEAEIVGDLKRKLDDAYYLCELLVSGTKEGYAGLARVHTRTNWFKKTKERFSCVRSPDGLPFS